MVVSTLACAGMAFATPAPGAQANGYRQPPQDVVAVLSAPKPPLISVAPGGAHALLLDPEVYTRLEDLARPAVSMSGRRIDPGNHAPRDVVHYSGLTLLDLGSGARRRLDLDEDVRIGYPEWATPGDRLAFPVFTATRVELWQARVANGDAARLDGVALNAATGQSFHWMPDGRRILCRLVPDGPNTPPRPPMAVPGPTVMEALGPRHGTPDDARDAGGAFERALFEYFIRTRLAFVDTLTGRIDAIGEPGLYSDATPSPDGQFILVTRAAPPDSRRAGMAKPPSHEIWNARGVVVATLSAGSDGVFPPRRERRGFAWRHTDGSTLRWIEDVFPGDGLRDSTRGERLMVSRAPFTDAPREVFRSESSITGIEWIDDSDLAIVHDYEMETRRANAWLVDVGHAPADTRRMWSRSIDHRYDDPGQTITRRNEAGREVVMRDGGSILLSAKGTTPQGERPFVARFSLDTLQTEVLWRSKEGRYETAIALLDVDDERLLIRHESPYAPPNYAVHNARDGARRELTNFQPRAMASFRVRRQVVTFQRDDGVTLQATLYQPESRAEGERLPLVLWAYPRSYADADSAGQVSSATARFSAFDRAIPAFLAMRGFAVMDQVSMPIVRSDDARDDVFVRQIVSSAKAAIDKAVEMGVADPNRVGVAGHSYGAFMTVTLLARSRLFKAGVALSGAYNRTLTPFGFQTERRTLWEAPGMYIEMSPFMYANRIDAPLLLIHGHQDENLGTAPMQSQRLFQAIRANGGVARLVMLPYEGHVYRARESVLHSAAEMLDWFSLHLRRGPVTAHSSASSTSG